MSDCVRAQTFAGASSCSLNFICISYCVCVCVCAANWHSRNLLSAVCVYASVRGRSGGWGTSDLCAIYTYAFYRRCAVLCAFTKSKCAASRIKSRAARVPFTRQTTRFAVRKCAILRMIHNIRLQHALLHSIYIYAITAPLAASAHDPWYTRAYYDDWFCRSRVSCGFVFSFMRAHARALARLFDTHE